MAVDMNLLTYKIKPIKRAHSFSLYLNRFMNEEYSFTKLADIRRQVSSDKNEFSSMGIVVDCTNPHRKDAKKDFCLKLKLIDPSSPTDACHVFLYSRHAEDFPKNIKLGDILLLHKYGFEVWNDSLQAKKHFKVMGAEFRFYSGEPTSEGYSPIGTQNAIDDFDGSVLNTIKELRKFSQTYFKKNNVPLYSKTSKLSSDFDLILQVTGSEPLNEGHKIHMKDTVNEFEINYSAKVENGIYKVRSIADLSWQGKKCMLTGNDYTCFLEIPSWMKSHESKEWEKLVVGKSEARSERDKIETKILNEKRGEKKKAVTLKDLVTKDLHLEEVVISCEFVECFTNFSDALRRYDAQNHTEKRYESAEGEYIYSVHYVVTDSSMEGELFNIYLYTHDKRGLQFLPGLHPEKIFGRNILNYQEKYDHINNRLMEETDFENCPLNIALSPMTNGRDTIYRIVDTELLI